MKSKIRVKQVICKTMFVIKIVITVAIILLTLLPFTTLTSGKNALDIHPQEVAIKTLNRQVKSDNTRYLAALCAIALDEEPYLQEWVDYYIGLGFDLVYIFDNSDSHDLKQWKKEQPEYVRVTHLPGISMQTEAYRQCAKNLLEAGKHQWAAFFDVDEFLVLRQYDSITSFLKKYLLSGALGINWVYMGTSNRSIYEPMPVSYRFNFRVSKGTNMHIKTIAVLQDINMNGKFHCHFLPMKPGRRTVDTNGRRIKGPFNRRGPENIAALYHFFSKSSKEFVMKRVRGRADTVKYDKSYYETLNESLQGWMSGDIEDNSVWLTLKKNVPKYSVYEMIHDSKRVVYDLNLPMFQKQKC
jgi:Glycosyl transferase family 2